MYIHVLTVNQVSLKKWKINFRNVHVTSTWEIPPSHVYTHTHGMSYLSVETVNSKGPFYQNKFRAFFFHFLSILHVQLHPFFHALFHCETCSVWQVLVKLGLCFFFLALLFNSLTWMVTVLIILSFSVASLHDNMHVIIFDTNMHIIIIIIIFRRLLFNFGSQKMRPFWYLSSKSFSPHMFESYSYKSYWKENNITW